MPWAMFISTVTATASIPIHFAQWMFISMSFFSKSALQKKKSVQKKEKCGKFAAAKKFMHGQNFF
jgi:hypothetical protein